MCSFLRCLHLKAAILLRSLRIRLFSSSSEESWKKQKLKKIVINAYYVTLNDTRQISIPIVLKNRKITTSFWKHALEMQFIKNIFTWNKIARSTYHFKLGSFRFEMWHSFQTQGDSSCFYRVSKSQFDFFFSTTSHGSKFSVARCIFARYLVLSRRKRHLVNG